MLELYSRMVARNEAKEKEDHARARTRRTSIAVSVSVEEGKYFAGIGED